MTTQATRFLLFLLLFFLPLVRPLRLLAGVRPHPAMYRAYKIQKNPHFGFRCPEILPKNRALVLKLQNPELNEEKDEKDDEEQNDEQKNNGEINNDAGTNIEEKNDEEKGEDPDEIFESEDEYEVFKEGTDQYDPSDAEETIEIELDSRGIPRKKEYITVEPNKGVDPAADYEPPEWIERLNEIYVAVCFDHTDSDVFESVRIPNMIDHIIWGRRSARLPDVSARVLFSRALLHDSLQFTVGNVIGIAAESLDASKELLSREPYHNAGLFSTVALYRWTQSEVCELNLKLQSYPHFVLGLDKKDSLELRKKTRPEHLEYLISLDAVAEAGPIFSVDNVNAGPIGTIAFLNAPNVEVARDMAMKDPYTLAGVFDKVIVHAFCDLNVDGLDQVNPLEYDPVRDVMEKEGLAVEGDYPQEDEEEMPEFELYDK